MRGQALVEFALILPLLVLLLVAVFDVGRFIFAYNSVTNAAREGARMAIVNQDPARVKQRAIDQAVVSEVAAPNVTVQYFQPQPNIVNPAANAACPSPVPAGCVAVITFQTTMRPLTPIIGRIMFSSGVTLTAKAVQAVEFSCPNSTTVAANCPKQP
jgi:Flp pilus assembly protein TadG